MIKLELTPAEAQTLKAALSFMYCGSEDPQYEIAWRKIVNAMANPEPERKRNLTVQELMNQEGITK